MLLWPDFLLCLFAVPPERRRPGGADQTEGSRTGTVNEYEILLMLDPDTSEERQNEIVTRMREMVDAATARWLSHDVWGRRRLAYEIDHKADGIYHLLQFDAEPAALDEITRVLRITDGVMRHMAMRRPKGSAAAPPPRAGPRSAPEERDSAQRSRRRPPERAEQAAGGARAGARSRPGSRLALHEHTFRRRRASMAATSTASSWSGT